MLSKHVISQLNPPENKPQHTRSAMFLDGLNQAGDIFHRRFRVTKPGLKRAHWSDGPDALKRKTVIPPLVVLEPLLNPHRKLSWPTPKSSST
jgi:hypothetical protein